MAYRMINNRTLQFIYDEYIRFRNQRIDCIKYIQRELPNRWFDDAQDDVRYGRRSVGNAQRWYDNRCYDLKKWVDECIQEIKYADARFEKLFNVLKTMKFSSEENGGTRYIFEFLSGQIKTCPIDDQRSFSVTISGYNSSYGWSPIPKDTVYFQPEKAPKPWFTDLLY